MTAFEMISRGGGNYRLDGNLTFSTVSEALRAAAPLFSEGAELCFDLGGIRRADSAGVALLIEWVRRARQTRAAIRYAHLPESLRAIIRVSGVEELLPVDPSPTQAEND